MMKMKKMAAMMMAMAMTTTALGSISAFAEEETTPSAPTITVGGESVETDTVISKEATPGISGTSFTKANEAEDIINITIEWNDMSFKYDFGNLTFDESKNEYNDPIIVGTFKEKQGWKVSGGSEAYGSDAAKPIYMSSLSNVPVNIEVSVQKSSDPLYENVKVYLDDLSGFYGKDTYSQTFTLNPEWNKVSDSEYILNCSRAFIYVHVHGTPDYKLMDMAENEIPTLFTYTFRISVGE